MTCNPGTVWRVTQQNWGNAPAGWPQGPQQPSYSNAWQQPNPGGQQAGGWQQPNLGGQQAGGWQRPSGWSHQGQWAQQQAPMHGPGQWGAPAPKRPALGFPIKVLLGVAVAAAVAFVVVLFVTSGTQYENEDYQPPEQTDAPDQLTIPQSREEAERLLTENPIYTKTAPANVNCEMPAIEPDGISPEELQAHFDQFTACLMRVWDPSLTDKAEGITFFRPRVTVYTGSISTGCGNVDVINAFYCGADQELYYHAELHEQGIPQAKVKGGIDTIMAHEFGHFIQGRSGILGARVYLGQNASEEEQLEQTRRSEAQADCLSAMWTRANVQAQGLTDGDIENLRDLYRAIGDDTLTGDPNVVGDHGHSATRVAWANKGYSTGDVGICNSWSAPADQVR